MKTATQIELEINKIRRQHSGPFAFSKKELDAARKELIFLERCLKYVTSECQKESYLNSDLKRLRKRLDVIEKSYSRWRIGNPDKVVALRNPLAAYRSEMGLNKVKKQIATLQYLLN